MPVPHDHEGAALSLLEQALVSKAFGDVAVVSSFGADSVVLLHLVARIDTDAPVIFIDTRMHFEETLRYRETVIDTLELSNVRNVSPTPDAIIGDDKWGRLHLSDANRCCDIRKTVPLHTALADFDGWVSGRKRFQSGLRSTLQAVERASNGKVKLNPLADWSQKNLAEYADRFDLPQHPLVDAGYRSIGCASCTSPVLAGEDSRAGRWRGQSKSECGIHIVDGKIMRGPVHEQR